MAEELEETAFPFGRRGIKRTSDSEGGRFYSFGDLVLDGLTLVTGVVAYFAALNVTHSLGRYLGEAL